MECSRRMMVPLDSLEIEVILELTDHQNALLSQ